MVIDADHQLRYLSLFGGPLRSGHDQRYPLASYRCCRRLRSKKEGVGSGGRCRGELESDVADCQAKHAANDEYLDESSSVHLRILV
jgi:hypothetical protein